MTNDIEPFRVALAEAVPCLRAAKGLLPIIDVNTAEVLAQDAETWTFVITDSANDVGHVFEYPKDHGLDSAVARALMRIYAPHN